MRRKGMLRKQGLLLLVCQCYRCFFFSSRRRHTRLQGDWSSDVCSSDLLRCPGRPNLGAQSIITLPLNALLTPSLCPGFLHLGQAKFLIILSTVFAACVPGQIGRASSRERV